MRTVTFQVVEGVDKGRMFRDLPIPVTVGREEGNLLRLNDERVSRFHAKVQQDDGDLILTDLESTNGTRVNGHVVQIRRLRPGDRVQVGRSVLVYGSPAEIEARRVTLQSGARSAPGGTLAGLLEPEPQTMQANNFLAQPPEEFDFDLNLNDPVTGHQDALYLGNHPLPNLPKKLSAAQAARLAEILDFLHHHLTRATEHIRANEEGTQITLGFGEWQKILAVQMLLARYQRAIAEPDILDS